MSLDFWRRFLWRRQVLSPWFTRLDALRAISQSEDRNVRFLYRPVTPIRLKRRSWESLEVTKDSQLEKKQLQWKNRACL